jgi:hypothetical protein
MPYLKQELMLREKIINERKKEEYLRLMKAKQDYENKKKQNKVSLLETKKQVRCCGTIANNHINLNNNKNIITQLNDTNINSNIINKNINQNKVSSNNKEIINNNDNLIVNKTEKMSIEINNNIKNNENIEIKKEKEKEIEKEKEKEEEINKKDLYQVNNNIKLCQNGFIQIQIETKKLNMAMTKIKKFLKNKGYFSIKRNLAELELEVSNGEIDILLKLEKLKQDYFKLNYFKLKGIATQFESFKKEIHHLKGKVL